METSLGAGGDGAGCADASTADTAPNSTRKDGRPTVIPLTPLQGVLTLAGAVSRRNKLNRPPHVAHTIMTTMCAASEVWSAIQPEIVGDNTPPTISPAPTTSPIDDAASAFGTVSDGTTPINTANEP